MSGGEVKKALLDIRESQNAILNAISALDGRLGVLDRRAERIEHRLDDLDRKINAIARNLLSPVECVGLGISDARPIPETIS